MANLVVASLDVRPDAAAIRALRTDPDVVALVEEAAGGIADALEALAPKHTGAAAASIDDKRARAAGAFNVGWDAAHYYLLFPEYGTKYQPPQYFARTVLRRYQFN